MDQSKNTSPSNSPRFCPSCGAQVPMGALYCMACGKTLRAGAGETPMQGPQYFPNYPPQNQYGPSYGSPYQYGRASNFGLAGLIVGIIGVFIVSIPLGIVAIVLGGVGLKRDGRTGLASGALCVGVFDLIFGIISAVLLFSFY